MEIRGLLDHVNRFLIQEWGADAKAPGLNSSIQISIAVCGVEIDRESVRLSVMNNGSPCPTLTSANGFSLELGTGSPPLGWFDDPETEVIRHAFEDGGHLLLWSDGLVDCADECGVLPHSLAYRLLHSDQADLEEKVIPHSRDDILLMRMDLSLQPDEREGFFPLIVANYNGDQAASIDELQQEWKRSLSFSLPSYSESIMDDVLLCSREAVLNAMKHGCHADAGLTCSFQVAYRPETLTLRVRVEDSGAGYEDEFLRNTELLEDDALMRHCGLILIREIPDRVEVERKGALLTLDFDIIGHSEKIRSTFCS